MAERDLLKYDPIKATTLYNMALLKRKQRKYIKATSLLKRSIKIQESYFGIDHPESADSLALMGALYRFQDKDTEAIQYLERALKIWKRTRSSDDPLVIGTYKSLIKLYNKIGKPDEATRVEDLLEKAGFEVEKE